jgi:chorismate mutase
MADFLVPLRAEMNAIDGMLFDLIERRFDLAGRIIRVKADAGLPIEDPDRERYILATAGSERLRRIMGAIIEAGKEGWTDGSE